MTPAPRPPLSVIALLTAGLLSACGGGVTVPPVSAPPVTAPTVTGVTLGGVSTPLLLGNTAQLSVAVTGSGGSALTGKAVTYASSDSGAVAVDAGGRLIARHLNATGTPVVITATVDGVSGTLSVSTYGLDVVGGTSSVMSSAAYGAGVSVAPLFYLRFRDAGGRPVSAQTAVTLTPPSGSGFGDPATASLSAGSEIAAPRLTNRAAVSGTFSASASVAGQTYTKTFVVDATRVLPFASGVSVATDSSGTNALLSGTLPSGAAGVSVVATSTDFSTYNFVSRVSALPSTSPWTEGPLSSGSYYIEVDAFSARNDTGVSTPEFYNASAYGDGPLLVR